MKSERLHVWISRIRGTDADPEDGVTEVVVGAPIEDSGPEVHRSPGQKVNMRTLGIVALVVFAPIVIIVIVKVLRDILSGSR